MAEVVAHFHPKLVEMHNYSAAHSIRQKVYNWQTLNRTWVRSCQPPWCTVCLGGRCMGGMHGQGEVPLCVWV